MILKKVWATESTNEITPNICCYFHCCCLVCHMTTPGRPNMGGGRGGPTHGQDRHTLATDWRESWSRLGLETEVYETLGLV